MEKRMKNRITNIVLLSIILSLFPFAVFAGEDKEESLQREFRNWNKN
jgi:hypothetical protein